MFLQYKFYLSLEFTLFDIFVNNFLDNKTHFGYLTRKPTGWLEKAPDIYQCTQNIAFNLAGGPGGRARTVY